MKRKQQYWNEYIMLLAV